MKVKCNFKDNQYWALFWERADDIVLADEAVVTTATPEQVKILLDTNSDKWKEIVRYILASNK
jgi:hypothetical protein